MPAVMQPAPVAAPPPGADRGRATDGSRRTPPPARRDHGDQIARLERDLAEALAAGFPRPEPARPRPRAPVAAGPRLLSLAELELVRDDLAVRLARLRSGGAAPLLAAMLADPAGHRGAVVTSADLGEPGCRTWAVRPCLGPLGWLAGWWRVVVSSGCPLGRARA